MNDDITTGDIEFFSVLFWTQPYRWDITDDEGKQPAEEDEEW